MIYNLSDIKSNIAVVIECKFDGDSETTSILLNTVEPPNIQATSSLSQYPLVSGDMTADHMFKNPLTMNLRGSFKFLSKSTIDNVVSSKAESHLAKIQALFERIKDESVLCNIVKIVMPDGTYASAVPRFTKRDNMTLTSINWVENISSMGFSFNFTQVMLSDIVEYDVDTDDMYLPSPEDPKMMSFSEEFLDWGYVDQAMYEALKEAELITKGFEDTLAVIGRVGLAATIGAAVGLGLAAGKTGALITSVLIAAGCSGPQVLVTGIIVAVVAVAAAVFMIIRETKRRNKYTVRKFEKYRNEKKMNKEIERFGKFVEEVHNNTERTLDGNILVYSLSDNSEQQCILSLDDDIYTFIFSKDNTSGRWKVKVYNNQTVVKADTDVHTTSLPNINYCTPGNHLFSTIKSGYYVYLMKKSDTDLNLTNYMILFSKVDLTRLKDIIADGIYNMLIGETDEE